MDEFIKDLDPNLDYLEYEIKENEVIIYVASNRAIGNCPYCGCPSGRIHGYYLKSFQDLPVMGKKQLSVLITENFFATTRNANLLHLQNGLIS